MKDTNTRAFAGIVGLLAAGLLATSFSTSGCGSDSNGTGTGGTQGTAGTTGSGGTGTGGTGTGGTGTGGTGTAACAAVTSTAITDFGGADISVGVSAPYTFADTGLTMPTVSVASGALVAMFDTGAPSTMYPYAGWGVPFNACADVSAYTGVKFTISGTLNTGCTIQFSLGDKQHSNSPPLGTCSGTCYPGAKIFTLPATPTEVTVLFSEISPGGPATPIVVPAEAIGVQWQLNVPAGDGSGGCVGNVTIDNVTLVQ